MLRGSLLASEGHHFDPCQGYMHRHIGPPSPVKEYPGDPQWLQHLLPAPMRGPPLFLLQGQLDCMAQPGWMFCTGSL